MGMGQAAGIAAALAASARTTTRDAPIKKLQDVLRRQHAILERLGVRAKLPDEGKRAAR